MFSKPQGLTPLSPRLPFAAVGGDPEPAGRTGISSGQRRGRALCLRPDVPGQRPSEPRSAEQDITVMPPRAATRDPGAGPPPGQLSDGGL